MVVSHLITYKNNNPSLGHDSNFFQTLKLSRTEYVWALSDSTRIAPNAITFILNLLDHKDFGIIAVNSENRDLSYKSMSYQNPNEVLGKFGWHLNLMGATIYSKDAINFIGKIEKMDFNNFPHFFLIFNYLTINPSFYWVNKNLVGNGKKKSYWLEKIFKVFIDDWERVVYNLPNNYYNKIKKQTVYKHSLNTGLFNIKTLLMLNGLNIYNYKIFNKYRTKLSKHSQLNTIILFFISVLPFKNILQLRDNFSKIN